MTHLTPEELTRFADGVRLPGEDSAAEEHLARCAVCREALEGWAEADAAVSAEALEAPSGYFDTLPERVLARLGAFESGGRGSIIAVAKAGPHAGRDEGLGGPHGSLVRFHGRRPTVVRWALALAAALFVSVLAPWMTRRVREESEQLESAATAMPAAPTAPQTPVGSDRAALKRTAEEKVAAPASGGGAASESFGVQSQAQTRAKGDHAQVGPLVGAGSEGPQSTAGVESPRAREPRPEGPPSAVSSDLASEQSRRSPDLSEEAEVPAFELSAAPSTRVPPGATPAADSHPKAEGSTARAAEKSKLVPPRLAQVRDRARRLEEASRVRGDEAQADASRLGALEAWLEAWRLGNEESDREAAVRLARTYVAAPAGLHKARAREVLEELGAVE